MNVHRTTVLADDFIFLEGPRWHAGRLWISDMWDHKVFKINMEGERTVVCDVPERPSGLCFLSDGTPVVVSMADRRLYKIKDGSLLLYADLSNSAAGDLNDITIDEDDRIYIGNFGYDLWGGGEHANSTVALVTSDGASRVVASELNFPNGMVLLNGGKTLVLAETWGRCLTAFDRASDGSLTNRRIFAQLGERTPDGICVDSAGGVWVSSFISGEFIRVEEGGGVTDIISCEGKRAVACALGGPEGRTLFCSTFAGELADIQSRKRGGAIETTSVEIGI